MSTTCDDEDMDVRRVRCLNCDQRYALIQERLYIGQEHGCPSCTFPGWADALQFPPRRLDYGSLWTTWKGARGDAGIQTGSSERPSASGQSRGQVAEA